MTIRSEQPGDRDAISAVHMASFETAMEAGIVKALREAGRLAISLIAVDGETIVGHVCFSPVTIAENEFGLGLGPVAVLPGFRQRGIAAQLIQEGLAECESTGVEIVVVIGDPRYYSRFGFVSAERHGLRDEFGAGAAFQLLELRAGAAAELEGVVCYAPEFHPIDEH